MSRVRISLAAETPEDRALIKRLNMVPDSRLPEYIRRLLSAGMVAVYGPGLDGSPVDQLPCESAATLARDFTARVRIDGIDTIECALLRYLAQVRDTRKHLFVRRLLLAGVRFLYETSPRGMTAEHGKVSFASSSASIRDVAEDNAPWGVANDSEAGADAACDSDSFDVPSQRRLVPGNQPATQSGLVGLM